MLSGCLRNSHTSAQRRAKLHSERLGFHYGDARPCDGVFPNCDFQKHGILRRSAGRSSPAADLIARCSAAAPPLPDTAPPLLPEPPSAQPQTPAAPVFLIPLWQSFGELCLPAAVKPSAKGTGLSSQRLGAPRGPAFHFLRAKLKPLWRPLNAQL